MRIRVTYRISQQVAAVVDAPDVAQAIEKVARRFSLSIGELEGEDLEQYQQRIETQPGEWAWADEGITQ